MRAPKGANPRWYQRRLKDTIERLNQVQERCREQELQLHIEAQTGEQEHTDKVKLQDALKQGYRFNDAEGLATLIIQLPLSTGAGLLRLMQGVAVSSEEYQDVETAVDLIKAVRKPYMDAVMELQVRGIDFTPPVEPKPQEQVVDTPSDLKAVCPSCRKPMEYDRSHPVGCRWSCASCGFPCPGGNP